MHLDNLTAEQVRSLLSYDPATGVLMWIGGRANQRIGKKAGYCFRSGYVGVCIDGTSYLAHRLAWLYMHGRWPVDQIDHINGNGYDNRLINLREATRGLNTANSVTIGKNRLKGTSLARSGRWQARIKKGSPIHLGTFDTEKEAHAAYVKAAKRLFGEFACDGVHVEPETLMATEDTAGQ